MSGTNKLVHSVVEFASYIAKQVIFVLHCNHHGDYVVDEGRLREVEGEVSSEIVGRGDECAGEDEIGEIVQKSHPGAGLHIAVGAAAGRHSEFDCHYVQLVLFEGRTLDDFKAFFYQLIVDELSVHDEAFLDVQTHSLLPG